MPKLVASYCEKRPGAQQYSSRGASASIEVEFDDLTTQGVAAKLRALWLCLREAVHEELERTPPAQGNGRTNGRTKGYEQVNGHNGNGAAATKKQLGFLLSLCKSRFGFSPSETSQWLQAQHQTSLDSMSKREAGTIIESLKTGQIA